MVYCLHDLEGIEDDEYNDSIHSQVRLPDCVFEFDGGDDDDQESIDSQALLDDTVVHQNDTDPDDDSIVSQDAEVDDDECNSLSSMISQALPLTASASATCSESSAYDVYVASSKKRVVFVPQRNEIKFIPTRKQFTQEEKANIWYGHSDMAAMRMSRLENESIGGWEPQSLVAIPEVDSFPEELRSSSFTMTLESPLHAHHLAGSFHLGTCRPTGEESEARISRVIDAVMDEQETQWLDDDEEDQDRLAQASRRHSRTCTKDAIMRAHLDALEAISAYLQAGVKVKDMAIRGEQSSSGKLRKDEEVYPLSPMSISPKASLTNRHRGRISKQSSKAVSESRWTPVSGKRASLAGKKSNGEDFVGSSCSPAMPKRFAESSSSCSEIHERQRVPNNHGNSGRHQDTGRLACVPLLSFPTGMPGFAATSTAASA